MKFTIYLLFPFDLGLELDFSGKDQNKIFKELATRQIPDLTLEGQVLSSAEVTFQIYRFGVGLIQTAFSLEADLERCAQLAWNADRIRLGKRDLVGYCQSMVEGIIERAKPYATYTYDQRLEESEVFPVFVLQDFIRKDAGGFIRRHEKLLYGIVANEPDWSRLSPFVLKQDPLENYGYYEYELILIKRYGSVVSSAQSKELMESIATSYAQYWSLRSYSAYLDGEMERTQKLLEDLPPFYKFWKAPQRYRRYSEEAIDFSRDKLSIVDSLYNRSALRIASDSDWYFRRFSETAAKVFQVEEMYREVELKLDRIESAYNSARDYIATNFFIILDFIFFFWLTWSILDTYLLWKMAGK
ncbi:MAG: hypothetical protein HY402_02035 [Elusimicrobia bacterium]|nr:hypothetical protein [Elusimicrobiota bacterium]